MLISYRDAKRYPSDPVAFQTWLQLAEMAARQIVCSDFDPVRFDRALHLCRRLTASGGSEALHRMVMACAAAGVALVLVPNFDRCRVLGASTWLTLGKWRSVAMIALSIRYRRDDQLYFSFFREAGAILMAAKAQMSRPASEGGCQRSEATVACGGSEFSPDLFARQFIVPPEHEQELMLLTAAAAAEGMAKGEQREKAVRAFAQKIEVAPGLVVGRLQHDECIGWEELNHLKREVDLTWVLRSARAVQETWPDQHAATQAVMKDLDLDEEPARQRVRRAVASGAVPTNGQARRAMRLDPAAFAAWRLAARDQALQEPQKAKEEDVVEIQRRASLERERKAQERGDVATRPLCPHDPKRSAA